VIFKSALESHGFAVGCWLAAGALLLVTAAAGGYDPFAADTWARWDSRHYLSIAGGGYELEPCRVDARDWCGNAGWFPAYPWLVSVLAAPGLPLAATAVCISWLFSLATLALLDRTFLRELPVRARVGGLVFAAFVPGVVYHHAAFPLATLGFFSVLALWLLRHERWAWAGVATAIAAATYHLGLLLVTIAIGFALASGGSPPVRERVGPALSPLLEGDPARLSAAPAAQLLLVTSVVGFVAWNTLRRRREADAAQWLLLATTLVLWLVPLTQENAGLYRTAAALVPAAPLVARLPGPLPGMLGVGAVALSVPMAILFLDWQIV
jgi:hypothetical protein